MKKTPIGIPVLAILSVCISLAVTPALAGDLTVFSNGSVANANDVNANFNELETRIETISLTPGTAGATGAQGIQGAQGLPGNAGADGALGLVGAQGIQGDAGTTGAQGAKGLPGNAGADGALGLVGAQGIQGDAGATGAQGVQGLSGNVGADGALGLTGAQGIQGDAGATGAQGVQGLSGNTGATGATGLLGLKGADGAMGSAGDQGIQGLAGADSIVAGPEGIQGATGASGVQGLTGNTGAAGADGIMYNGAFEGDMQYWNGNAWMMISAPAEDASSLSFCDGQPTWTQGECPVFYEIGDVGPAGGWIFYITDGGLHGIEAAPLDQDEYYGTGAEWGCYGEIVSGAFGTSVGEGKTNTATILAHTCTNEPDMGNKPHRAAILASSHNYNGFEGWFLPSKDELNLMYENLHINGVGGFADTSYWSSSQINNNFAWQQYFTNGSMASNGKGYSQRVRAVRVF
ncbi:DUF1566 domain-containing protein [Colwellia sp. MB02u-10]|uniref:DUF1566 domain-containing protein n=1 Tax=Colwellia sp. MB02u-10 TaxID=2759828 RepID=UPI0015F53B0A|nr:DUF1566 domain-containing protein [Colwellia sp. MB02u-10]MBA6340906.1 DUF1566 domain-containing protein [Colwellia sp. MB02u-10]